MTRCLPLLPQRQAAPQTGLNAGVRAPIVMAIPKEIIEKIDAVNARVEHRMQVAEEHLITELKGSINFRYSISAPRDILTEDERAQSICFVTRYDALPEFGRLQIEERQGSFYAANFYEMRGLLNEYRSIIQNKKDSIHFQKIHRFVRDKLLNQDHSQDLSIKVTHENDGDITDEFLDLINENIKAIKSLIKYSDFGYIYNGILQHSDNKTSHRFLTEYASGELNYVFMYHALIASNIKILMRWHYRLFGALTFPVLGPL